MLDLSPIVASLTRRGFIPTPNYFDLERVQTQVDAVLEELAEVARDLRRVRQGVREVDETDLATECADVVIAGVCLLACVVGDAPESVILAKMSEDEATRGRLHNGGTPHDNTHTGKPG